MVNIGDRVRYDEENVALDDCEGTVVEPTDVEISEGLRDALPSGVVMIEWNDGTRYWEHQSELVIVQIAEERR